MSVSLIAQETTDLQKQEIQLIQLSNSFIKDSLVEKRIKSAKAFEDLLSNSLTQAGSFDFPFENLETVSILYPKDSTFRIFTWQLYLNKKNYQYGGLIQVNNDKNQIIPLNDQSAEIASYDIEYDILSSSDWYGAVYFNIHEFDTKEGKRYLLFGFDGFEFFNKRKVLEVLHFDENGAAIFGAPVFATTAEGYEASTKNRLYMEYSSEIAAKLNYDPQLDMIIKDHLVTMRSPYRGVGNVNVPDGSYEGYKLNNGIWEYVEKVFNLVSEEPPAPQPVLENRSNKDLFGKTKKKKKKRG